MKKFIFILMLVVFQYSSVYSYTSFRQTYGNGLWDIGVSAQQTEDGGYILFGYTDAYSEENTDLVLLKTDSLGNEEWSQMYDLSSLDFGASVRQTNDGGYVICGNIHNRSDSVVVIKTNNNGVIDWEEQYSISVDSGSVSAFIRQTSDGGYIVSGWSGTFAHEDVYVLKINSLGKIEWEKFFLMTGRQISVVIREVVDGYVVGGNSDTSGNDKDMFLMKIDKQGNHMWINYYGDFLSDEWGGSMCVTSDGGYALVGYQGSGNKDIIIVKTDSLGSQQWKKYYGGTEVYKGNFIQETSYGGLVVGGRKENIFLNSDDMYLLKLDSLGNFEWDNHYYNGIISDAAYTQQTKDGGYMLFGITSVGGGTSNIDMYLVKTVPAVLPFVSENYNVASKIGRFNNFHLYNEQGQLVFIGNSNDFSNIRQNNNFPSGIYFYILTNSEEKISGKVFLN